jgi:hypothetical protein
VKEVIVEEQTNAPEAAKGNESLIATSGSAVRSPGTGAVSDCPPPPCPEDTTPLTATSSGALASVKVNVLAWQDASCSEDNLPPSIDEIDRLKKLSGD